ncbi:hypothetical protein ACTMTI_51485 [Nonomuraea sp. H19]|uniref:hypothetical protein n=1 Tax=Nonomuraea sp. H19 TaxID=3452206 RepID=UPI003F890FC5
MSTVSCSLAEMEACLIMIQSIEEIVFDEELSVAAKGERVTALLALAGTEGIAAAITCLMETSDSRVAEHVAAYLEMIPGAQAEKTRAAERLRRTVPLARSAARLVPWLPAATLDAFIQDYLAVPYPDSPYSAVLFNIGIYFPERLRHCADRIDSPSIKQSLLSGAADDLADALLAEWKNDGDLDHLWALALIRTEHAAELIASVRDEVPNPEDWEWLMPLAGRLPDTGKAAGFHPAFMGFVADKGASNHIMGGTYSHQVPLCAECGAPAERVLTLSAGDLPHNLSHDPSFFWFSCDCDEVDVITVRFTGQGTKVYFNPQGPASREPRLIPGERSMVLEPHPNQTGVSKTAIPGSVTRNSHHQVGGLPRWPTPETHPICPECGNFMPFLAAVDSGPTPFGPVQFPWLLFGFWCDGCAVSTTRTQT